MTRIEPDLRFLMGLLGPYRASFVVGSLFLVLDGALLLAQPWFAVRVAQAVMAGTRPEALLLGWILLLGCQALTSFAHGLILGRVGADLVSDLGARTYNHLQALPIGWHQERRRGETLAILTNDVWRISRFLSGTFSTVVPLLATCAGALVLMIGLEPRAGLAVALASLGLVVVLKLTTRGLRPLAAANLREDALKFSIADENMASLQVIKAFTREQLESTRFADQGDKVRRLEVLQVKILSALVPAARWFAASGVIALLWMGSDMVARGALRPAELLSLLLYGLVLAQPVSQLVGFYGQLQLARGSSNRLLALLVETQERDVGSTGLTEPSGDIVFENVAFSYPGRPPVFTSLDWRLRAGETVAITGKNGTGKSTLTNLMMRFVDPSGGRITLDGVDLKDLPLRGLRSKIGLVSQDMLVLNRSIADNIGFGLAGASQDQIVQAAKMANADPFVALLPSGYDTIVGDKGVRLSGGQRQRIALARALLKDPPILILDEATSMFDPAGEAEFLADSKSILDSRTVILVTHRPASLALADRIYELDGGRLEERPSLRLYDAG